MSFNPQSTLRADLVPWETQHQFGRSQDWTGSFSDGAVECAAAGQAYIFFDPFHRPDRRHAARYNSPNVMLLRAPYLGHGLPDAFRDLGVLKAITHACLNGSMTPQLFAQFVAERRTLSRYWRTMIRDVAERRHLTTAADLCDQAWDRFGEVGFRYRKATIRAAQRKIGAAFALIEAIEKDRRRTKREKHT